MMRALVSFLCGALFGAGLLVSGMTNPAKVQGWLDFFGDWDPTLAFVMGGAIVPMFFAWRIAARRHNSVLGSPLPQAPAPVLDRRLLVGSSLFGFGWALVGLCPGPAMAVLLWAGPSSLLFFAAMVAGMILARLPHLMGRTA